MGKLRGERMSKRIIAILGAVVMTVLLFGCGASRETTTARFRVTDDGDTFWTIYRIVDTETGVQYISVPNGGTCVIVDRDGKPLIANGWRDYDE